MFTTFSLAVILDCTVRIVLGTALGALIGLERQLRARSAGIRTNALVELGYTLFVLANPLFRAIGSFIDRRRSINDYETVGHEYTFEVRCLQQHEVKIRSLVFDAVHRPGFSVRSIAATDLPDDIVSITAVLDTTKRNDADIEKSIEAVIQTPEVLGVRWDVEHITTSD